MLELEKLINTNQKMRLKYASDPLKSISSSLFMM